MSAEAEINQLIEESPFEISTIERLEAYLLHQCEQKKYHFDANKALLKNYQVHTRLINPQLIAKVLILALMHLPSPDYLALSYLIPTTLIADPTIKYLASLSNLLERANYTEFWASYDAAPANLFDGISGAVEAFRAFILHTLRDAFKNIPIEQFQGYTRLSSPEEFAAFVAAHAGICEVNCERFVLLL